MWTKGWSKQRNRGEECGGSTVFSKSHDTFSKSRLLCVCNALHTDAAVELTWLTMAVGFYLGHFSSRCCVE